MSLDSVLLILGLASLVLLGSGVALVLVLSRVREERHLNEALREEKGGIEERLRSSEAEVALLRDELRTLGEKAAADEVRAQLLEVKCAELQAVARGGAEERDRLAGELRKALIEGSELKERLSQQEFRIKEQQELLRQATERLRDTFGVLSHEALEKNVERFKSFIDAYLLDAEGRQRLQREDAERLFDGIGRKIQEKLVQVEETIRGFDSRRAEVDAQLKEQIVSVNDMGKRVGDEAKRLAEALTKSAVQGSWGELKLRSVVEAAGMDKYCDFTEQVETGNDGGRKRPDMVIRLPGGLRVVVDAKSPLTNYLKAVATEGETRSTYLGELVKAMKLHIRDVANRKYPTTIDNCFEYTLLFLPIEGMFFLALEHDERLLEYATEHKVLLTTPLSLIALLRSIAAGWTQLRVQENVEEIRNLGRELYGRLGILFRYAGEMGRSLEKSVDSYNKMVVSWNTRLIPSARRFDELGAGTERKIDSLVQLEVLPARSAVDEVADCGDIDAAHHIEREVRHEVADDAAGFDAER